MSEKTLKALAEANKKAKDVIEPLKRSMNISNQQLHDIIKEYIQYKFLLTEDDFYTENILELAKISLGRQLNVNIEKLKAIDIADCSGATTSMTKKVLLIMSIEKELNIEFSSDEFSKVDSIIELCDRIRRNLVIPIIYHNPL